MFVMVWPKTQPCLASKTRPAQPNYRPGPAKPDRQIFALRPKIRPGPAPCYLIPLSSDMSPFPSSRTVSSRLPRYSLLNSAAKRLDYKKRTDKYNVHSDHTGSATER